MNEITKNLMCVVVRGDIEVWIDEEKVDSLMALIEKSTIVKIGNNILNTKDIVGIFEPQVIEDRNHKKNRDYTCKYGVWHGRNDVCGHVNKLGYKD